MSIYYWPSIYIFVSSLSQFFFSKSNLHRSMNRAYFLNDRAPRGLYVYGAGQLMNKSIHSIRRRTLQ